MAAEGAEAAVDAGAGDESGDFTVVPDLDGVGLREIGDEAEWSLSSSKPGFGASHLRDNDVSYCLRRRLAPLIALARPRARQLDTFWQTDALTPHTLVLSFARRVRIVQLAMYIDAGKDDSYTPEVVRIRAGTSERDASHVSKLTLQPPPHGWVVVPLHHERDASKPLRAYTVQIYFDRMMHAGKDLHVRQLRIFAPRSDAAGGAHHHPASSRHRSSDFLSYATIR